MNDDSAAPTPGSTAPGTAAGPVPLETAGVPTGSRGQWLAAAAAVLRKTGRLSPSDRAAERSGATEQAGPTESDVLELLSRHTLEGVSVPALSSVGDGGDRPDSRRGIGNPQGWDIRVPIADPDRESARAALLTDLQGGASSLWLTVGDGGTDPQDLAFVLEPVLLDVAPVVLQCAPGAGAPAATIDAFTAVLTERGVTPAAGSSFGVDPLGDALHYQLAADLASIGEIAHRATSLGIGALVVDGTAAHDIGAGDVQELGWALAVGATYLRELEAAGITGADAAGLLSFRYAVTDEQFVSIAKLRAARQLWVRVLELSEITAGPQAVPQLHAVTSRPMMTRYDPWVNMLRGTIAAFAAGVAGAQAISVLPFDSALGIPDGFGRRIARNVSHLLIGESRLAAVSDPAGGASAIEQLTNGIAESAWAEFGRIERAGGAAAVLADGSMRAAIDELRIERARQIADRRRPLTGLSEFPQLGETPPRRRPAAVVDRTAPWAQAYQQLRDKPAGRLVFLATIGPVAAHGARAGFAANALAAGGIGVVRAGPTDGPDAVVACYDRSVTPVVCLAGSDAGYTEHGAATIAALRRAGARTVLMAGEPGCDLAGLTDDRITIGADIPAFCRRVRDYLGEDPT